jgi:tetratricopeptide (TPR) repeat protein
MSRQTWTELESQSLPNWATSPPTLPHPEWGSIVLILGLCLGWHLVGKRRRNASVPELPGSPLPEISQLPFTQAMQWVGCGKELEQAKQYESAIAVYAEGLKRFPNNFRLWHEQGLAFAKLQRFEEAIASYDRAYELRPQEPNLAHERGDTLLQLERYEEAIAAFDVFLKYTPDSAHILADRGYALYCLGRYEEALQWLNPIVQSQPRDRSALQHAHYYQIASLWQLGELEAALQSYQQAIQRYPNSSFQTQQAALRQQIARLTQTQDSL